MQSELVPRVGTFLILVGIGLIMVFVTYELGGTAHFDYFLISLIFIFIGIRLRLSGKSASPGARFNSVRSIHEKYKQKQDHKTNKEN